MAVKSRRQAMAAGLGISALVHLLVFGWNPVVQFVPPQHTAAATLAAQRSPDQLISYVLTPGAVADDDEAGTLPPAQRTTPLRRRGALDSGGRDGLSRTGVPLQPGREEEGAIARLRAPFRLPLAAPAPETPQQRVQREFEERERATRGDPQPENIPPATTTIPRVLGGGINIGIAIPAGRTPPPRAQTVPAPKPPPEILRADSLRAAAIMDSIRAERVMRDSLQRLLRRRPSGMMPARVRPDTIPGQ